MPAFDRKVCQSRNALRCGVHLLSVPFWLKRINHFRFSLGNGLYHRFRCLHHIGYLATYPVVITRRDVISRLFPLCLSIMSHCQGSSLFIPLDSSSDMDGFLWNYPWKQLLGATSCRTP